jgi:hypothetical protein
MVELEPIGLQQGEEEGRRWECEPGQHIGGEKKYLVGLQVGERNGSMTDPPIVFRHLLAKQPPHPHEVLVGLKAGGAEAGHHWRRWWSGSRRRQRDQAQRKKTVRSSTKRQMRRGYPRPQGFLHLHTSPSLGKPVCAMTGPTTLFAAYFANDKGDPGPPVSGHGSNRQ